MSTEPPTKRTLDIIELDLVTLIRQEIDQRLSYKPDGDINGHIELIASHVFKSRELQGLLREYALEMHLQRNPGKGPQSARQTSHNHPTPNAPEPGPAMIRQQRPPSFPRLPAAERTLPPGHVPQQGLPNSGFNQAGGAARPAPPPSSQSPQDGRLPPSPAAAPSPSTSSPSDPARPRLTESPTDRPQLPQNPASASFESARPSITNRKESSLRPARVSQLYEEPLPDLIRNLRNLEIKEAAVPGITVDAGAWKLRGTPTQAGNFQLAWQGLLDGRPTEIRLNLAVIADPKSLWKTLPSDRSDPFWKADWAFQESVIDGGMHSIAGSKRGRSHAQAGGFRDDDFKLFASPNSGWHIAIVADGAGSAKKARLGSRLACEHVCKHLPSLLEAHAQDIDAKVRTLKGDAAALEPVIREMLRRTVAATACHASAAIEEHAAELTVPSAELSTTLLITVARRIDTFWFVGCFAVGDGGAAVYDAENGKVSVLNKADSGEYAGQTRFLRPAEFVNEQEVQDRIYFGLFPKVTAIVTMTDGITDPKFPTEKAMADPATWHDFWHKDIGKEVDFSTSNKNLEKDLENWIDFWSQGNHDDRTIAIMIPT